jgi:hypothetical protein
VLWQGGSISHSTGLPRGSIGGGLDRRCSMPHGLGTAHRTFAAAISRRAITTSRLSATMSGLAPFASCRARFEASITSSKRLETLPKQSSTVILAMNDSRPPHLAMQGKSRRPTRCRCDQPAQSSAFPRSCPLGEARFIFCRDRIPDTLLSHLFSASRSGPGCERRKLDV